MSWFFLSLCWHKNCVDIPDSSEWSMHSSLYSNLLLEKPSTSFIYLDQVYFSLVPWQLLQYPKKLLLSLAYFFQPTGLQTFLKTVLRKKPSQPFKRQLTITMDRAWTKNEAGKTLRIYSKQTVRYQSTNKRKQKKDFFLKNLVLKLSDFLNKENCFEKYSCDCRGWSRLAWLLLFCCSVKTSKLASKKPMGSQKISFCSDQVIQAKN